MAEKRKKPLPKEEGAKSSSSTNLTATDSNEPLLVVGIGASAGGFQAVRKLLSHLPAGADLALVLIQHLKPDFESNLPELLAKSSDLQVLMAKDGMAIEKGRLYILPPGQLMVLDRYRMLLEPREKLPKTYRPIDRFFESLGSELGEAAVAVILSGSGSDGTAGIRTVKAEGGFVLAQDESSAEFTEMPRHAVESGSVDQVLPPEEIARKLADLCGRIEFPDRLPRLIEGETDPDPIVPIFQSLRKIGVDFSHYKQSTVRRRIARRMVLHQLPTLEQYAGFLQDHPEEAESLKEDLLIKVTSFFRNPDVFDALRRKVFPAIVRDKPSGNPVRLWVPGCATGEEVYSLAISLAEFLAEKQLRVGVQIFGTDISDAAIEKARRGIYREAAVADLSEEQLNRHFVKTAGGYQVAKNLREMVIFSRQDFTRDPPFSRLDLISCRNVLIYFGAELQQRVMPLFHFSLRPEGFLVLGSSEAIGRFEDLFSPVDKKHRIYIRKAAAGRLPRFFTPPGHPLPGASYHHPQPATSLPPKEADLERAADRILLRKYNPAAVVVNENLDILHFRGDTSPYLEHYPGKASLNLVKMARDVLGMELRSLLHRAGKEHKPQSKEHVHIPGPQGFRKIRLDVTPFSAREDERHFLIQFEQEPEPPAPSTVPPGAEDAEALREIEYLRQELSANHDYTQTLIEEKESALEELKVANEEILSSNEELQSINEELETAKEELESTNEELVTVNTELQNRNDELKRANDDLQNLILSAEIPFVIVGTDLCIRRTSPLSESILNVRPEDLGRSISDLQLRLEISGLEKLIGQVVETNETVEQEIRTRDGLWNLLRIRPYRTAESGIEGVVLSLVINIDRLTRSMEEIEQTYKYALRIVDSIKDPLLVLDDELRVRTANPAFYETFQVNPGETDGRLVYELGAAQWDIPELRRLLEQILPKSNKMDNFLVQFEFPHLGRRSMMLSARKMFSPKQNRELILLSIEDVTPRLAMEEELRQARRRAETANRAKSEFLANMSHEIRTPMAVVLGAIEQLQQIDFSPEQQGFLAMADNSAKALMELLGEILDFSMIEANKIQLEQRPFLLREWAEQSIAILHAQARRKALDLAIEVAPEVPEVIVADSHRLRQVLVNLIGNALKFTEQGEIKVTVDLVSDSINRRMVRFAVRDTGIGIPEDKLDLIFETFSQADSSMTRKHGGTGLGLAICKRLMERMGGAIDVHSEEGKGSTFTFIVPLVETSENAAPSAPEATEKTPMPINDTLNGPARVLVVEDDKGIRDLMALLLKNRDCEVTLAEGGEEALRRLEAGTFDLVLMDWQMPDMDGREVTRIIREAEKRTGRHLPILGLTGHARKEDRDRCLEAGMDGYLSKPFSQHKLFEEMGRLLEKSTET